MKKLMLFYISIEIIRYNNFIKLKNKLKNKINNKSTNFNKDEWKKTFLLCYNRNYNLSKKSIDLFIESLFRNKNINDISKKSLEKGLFTMMTSYEYFEVEEKYLNLENNLLKDINDVNTIISNLNINDSPKNDYDFCHKLLFLKWFS